MTTRTLEEVFWLHPLLCSRLAPVNREARLVVRAPGRNLAAFMGYFLARVAQTLNLLLGR